jgi:hypothetical protein
MSAKLKPSRHSMGFPLTVIMMYNSCLQGKMGRKKDQWFAVNESSGKRGR